MQPSQKFFARRERCTPEIQQILEFLMREAERAGTNIEKRFDAKGEGITYYSAGKPFCRFDPKHRVQHVWAWISGGDPAVLRKIGHTPERKHGPWVQINSFDGAKRLLPEIRSACDRARSR